MSHPLFGLMICLGLLIDPYSLRAEQHPEEFGGSVTSHVAIRYLPFTPEEYKKAEGKKWPLILYLHGGSRRGSDVEKLREPGYGLLG